MARERAVVQAFTGDGPILVAIHDALADLHDLLDARLPKHDDGDGPVRISEPAPACVPPGAVPISEPAPDGPSDEDDEAVEEPAPDLPEPPPRAGRGSSLPAWQAWAEQADVDIDSDMTRDQIIDACTRAGVLS
jgi:hypothetical protein